ncbi:hypothetical protein E2R51_03230 [Jeotgalibacillus sp. S-D1]|uniref:sporulation protein YpjB n=1 Tax=Jeotgalibacillus sp. S-D1 TaxID=2552189 RepID=UPI001059B740|nr:sporulation protein YpjB [Jeotgalibacillus sp. S-D1]TDL34747.1 hypothetical protein E2R51_03230 [Jeotgalibacillus sp. S-D1]
MKNRHVIMLLIFFLLVVPFQSVRAASEFETVIQYIAAGDYEEGVDLLHSWFTQIEKEQQVDLYHPFTSLISELSSEQLTHDQKVLSVWSFVSLAEYSTKNTVEYTRFLTAKLDSKWQAGEELSDAEAKELNELYNAMVPTLQLISDRHDQPTMQTISKSVSGPLLFSAGNESTLPPFDVWYNEQTGYSTLWIVSFITGAVVITALSYVSWRKYDGEIRRKRIRNHND